MGKELAAAARKDAIDDDHRSDVGRRGKVAALNNPVDDDDAAETEVASDYAVESLQGNAASLRKDRRNNLQLD